MALLFFFAFFVLGQPSCLFLRARVYFFRFWTFLFLCGGQECLRLTKRNAELQAKLASAQKKKKEDEGFARKLSNIFS